MKIWLGNLAYYNEDELRGEWLALPMTEEELEAAIRRVCGISDDEEPHEYFIADWECGIEGLVHEYSNPKELNETAAEIEKIADSDFERIKFLMEDESFSFQDALEKFEDVENWVDHDMTDVAYDLVEQGCIKIENYVDYEAIARDLSFDGYIQKNGSVFRFCN